jgi:cobalt-zinc-cadmium efflux system membrane fusion protein
VRRAIWCLLALAWLALACGTGTKTDELPGPQVEGDHVVIAEGSPQLAALSLDEARPRSTPVRQYTGRLAWNDDVTVRVYSPVAGRVRDVKVNVGERVTGGQTLASISSPDFGQAQADARAADGQLRLAERTLARQRDLFAHGAAARKDVDAAEAEYARAVAEQQRTQAHLRLFGARDTTVDQLLPLRSPVAGMIAERAVSPGQEVRPDQILASEAQVLRPLFVVTDPTRLWVWLDVAEVDLAQLQPGESISLRARAYPDRRFDGVIDLVGASLDPATRTVRVRGSVANPEGLLKSEMYIAADVTDGEGAPPGVELPSKALFLEGEQRFVFVEESPGRFRRQPVTVGPERGGRSAVLEGVKPGQRVVTEGNLLLEQLVNGAAKG